MRIDAITRAMTLLYDPNPTWDVKALPAIERLNVSDKYGEDSFAHLVHPLNYRKGQTYPLVIVQYRSRGFLRGGTGGEYPIFAYARAGYFVLSVDRPEPRALLARARWPEVQRDTELSHREQISKQSALVALIEQLTARGLIDKNRIAITGLSDGAETVFYGIVNSDLFAVAVASSPPSDPMSYALNTSDFRGLQRAQFGMEGPLGSSQTWASWWRRSAIAPRANDIHAPLLMQLSDAEMLSALPLRVALEQASKPAELIIYPGAYHLKWRPRQLHAAQRRAFDWIDFWLRGRENADPIDPDQYARWRALRALSAGSPRTGDIIEP